MEITERNFDNVPEADVVVRYINARFRKGLNTNIFIIGLSGTGKSSATIRIPELVIATRPKENLKLTIVDSLLSLLKAIKESKEGDLIGIEEISVLFPSRRAMSKDNVAVGKIFDTIRKKKLCLISNAPLWTSVDSHIKAMMNMLIETMKVYISYGVVVSKFYRLQTSPSSGKIYRHNMIRKGKEVNRMITRMPNSKTWAEYEADKDKFMDNLYEKLNNEALKKEGKVKFQIMPLVQKTPSLTERQFEVYTLSELKGLKNIQIANKLNLNPATITRLLQKAKEKMQIAKENGEIVSIPRLEAPLN